MTIHSISNHSSFDPNDFQESSLSRETPLFPYLRTNLLKLWLLNILDISEHEAPEDIEDLKDKCKEAPQNMNELPQRLSTIIYQISSPMQTIDRKTIHTLAEEALKLVPDCTSPRSRSTSVNGLELQ